MKIISSLLLMLFFVACQPSEIDKADNTNPYPLKTAIVNNDFNDYWYAGKAEITSYELEQSRYGEIHNGKAAFIFVTEPFSKSKQVKLDYPDAKSKDNVSVLKMNATRKFTTGIYPYSTIQSVFTPIKHEKHPNTLKVATSSQEWCGHTFEQLNLKKDHFDHQVFSYFEAEGDSNDKIEKAWLEDELFNRIRIQPSSLPTGEIKIIPSTLFARFGHTKLAVQKANVSLKEATKKGQMHYQINYPSLGRTLSIYFQKDFPHVIESWEEGLNNRPNLVTRATRIKTLKLDYWSKHSKIDGKYRKELGLE